jgi:hypothetical protein
MNHAPSDSRVNHAWFTLRAQRDTTSYFTPRTRSRGPFAASPLQNHMSQTIQLDFTWFIPPHQRRPSKASGLCACYSMICGLCCCVIDLCCRLLLCSVLYMCCCAAVCCWVCCCTCAVCCCAVCCCHVCCVYVLCAAVCCAAVCCCILLLWPVTECATVIVLLGAVLLYAKLRCCVMHNFQNMRYFIYCIYRIYDIIIMRSYKKYALLQ